MYLLINGAFGVGKTTVARELRDRLQGVIVDPEKIGFVLQRTPGLRRGDFQEIALWRSLTLLHARISGQFNKHVIIPMAISDLRHLGEIRRGLARSGRPVLHFCLTAPLELIYERLAIREGRGNINPWVERRAAECCGVHHHPEFAEQVATENLSVADVATVILQRLRELDHR